MMQFKIVSGYTGELGDFTARKIIDLPFFPFDDMELIIDKIAFIVRYKNLRPLWDADRQRGEIFLNDVSDDEPKLKGFSKLEMISRWFEAQGWETFDLTYPEKQ